VRKISDGSSASRNRPLKLSANPFSRRGRRAVPECPHAALLALALYHCRDYFQARCPFGCGPTRPSLRHLIKYRQDVLSMHVPEHFDARHLRVCLSSTNRTCSRGDRRLSSPARTLCHTTGTSSSHGMHYPVLARVDLPAFHALLRH
jgi:hypothetical protein